ncbi:MAG TPA: DUF2203 domain-containing protein [Pyrinomonadaceae bacterium]|nr:DUF2203 domain-containing protein [Pyrinomonadaceae bacterium]
MKLFTLDEANALLPTVRLIIEAISRAHRRVAARREAAQVAAAGAALGGGYMPGAEKYLAALLTIAERGGEIEALGVQIKDYERGLIDFPTLREGRVVLLCWQLGEGDSIEWWHDLEADFAGRQPI